jgi:hypothetical protein
MVWITRITVLGVLAFTAVPARAAQSAGTCAGPPTVSALNQYCENVPGAAGGHTPGPGTPALATTLPPRVVRQLASTSPAHAANTRLLALPAPTAHRRSLPVLAAVRTNALSPFLVLILVLVALTLVLVGIATTRRHRRSIAA